MRLLVRKDARLLTHVAPLLAVALLASCGSSPGTGSVGDDVDVIDVDAAETGEDVGGIDVSDDPDTGADAVDAVDADEPDAGGEFGEPCLVDEDCESLLCVDLVPGEGGGFCAQPCTSSAQCPDGSECVVVGGSGADVERICIPLDLCIDGDGDEYGVGPGCLGPDCDDLQAGVNPAANELCDGIDNDCDRVVDEFPIDANVDCLSSFPGACAPGRTTCVDGTLECVGASPTAEVCDDIDNDCDGVTDEDTELFEFYLDADGDGFGDASAEPVQACRRPAGHVENRVDCNDADRAVNPAAAEVPGDGVDQNCDGQELCYVDGDGDAFRTDAVQLTPVLACNEPGLAPAAMASGDCNDAAVDVNPAAAERVGDGVDSDCDGQEICYEDRDGDGYRTETMVVSDDVTCSAAALAPASRPAGDCNDDEPLAWPGFAEVCDGIDNNCDGRVDEGARCYPDGDPCVDNIDCMSEACLRDVCVDPAGCLIPGSCPSRVGIGAGGLTVGGGRYTMTLSIGTPMPVNETTSGRYEAVIGLGAFISEPIR